jgi:hypothetical protein
LAILVIAFGPLTLTAQTTRTSTTVGSLWFDGGTGWSAGVPDGSDNVTFSNSAKATIQNGQSSTILALIFGNNAILTINSGGSLTVNGAFTTNNGTILNIDGNLVINGDITVNNNLTWNINGSVTVNGNVNVNNNSTFDVNNSGTLNITGNFTGGTNTNFQVDGNVNIGGNLTVGNGSTATGTGTVNVGGSCSDGTSTFCNQGPLPVELVSFEGTEKESSIILVWVTASQLNFSHFEIEHSLDGEQWNMLAATQGEGTTSERMEYTYTDDLPGNGKNYYRLRMVDLDGTFKYSPVILVSAEVGKAIAIIPNPVVDNNMEYRLSFEPAAGDRLAIYDLTGAQLYSVEPVNFSGRVELPTTIKSGTYLVRYKSSTFTKVVRLLVK